MELEKVGKEEKEEAKGDGEGGRGWEQEPENEAR